MARSIQEIQNAITAEKNTKNELNGLNSPSNVAIWLTWTYITAVAINLHEQIFDLFKSDVSAIADRAIPATGQWWFDQIKKFQYSASNPQNIVLIDLVPTYSTIDPDLRILTRVSINQTPNLVVNIKVAKEEPPVILGGLEYSALLDYVATIGPAGIKTNVVNADADRLRLELVMYYDPSFGATFPAAATAALNEYMANLPFDGIVKPIDIADYLQQVDGFKNILPVSIKARSATTPLVSATEVSLQYATFSGRIIEEDTAGNTFADTISFIAQTS